jgi:hypothetical protein
VWTLIKYRFVEWCYGVYKALYSDISV